MNLYNVQKRIFDLSIISVSIIFLLIIGLIISLCLLLCYGRPVFFRQCRAGYLGRKFNIYKFRTMVDYQDKEGNLLPDRFRMTIFGRLIRKTSLDELPEIWNVIRGDMSLVGPRPLLIEYLNRYNPEQARRHKVMPGITGWAQINGRNAISWEEKFNLDVWYVDNVNLWLDIKILFLTMVKVLKMEGITAKGHTTMPEFEGNKKIMF